ncbi:MAG TPA: periplasmic heavy metal sensor [Thermoanaerobaculia bacterium]|nr:periplasmic heavy metal sensor [Thermoanaerobaculia bacterium]
MKRHIVISMAVIALVALVAVPILYAQGHGRGHGNGFPGIMMLGHLAKAQEELGLSDQQVSDIKAIFKQLHDQNAPYKASLRGGFVSIAQTLLQNPNDVATAQKVLDQQNAAEQAVKANTLVAASKALNVLTPDQRAKLAAKLAAKVAAHSHSAD